LTASSDTAAGDVAPPERRAQVMSGYSDWMGIGAASGPPLAFMLAERLGLFSQLRLHRRAVDRRGRLVHRGLAPAVTRTRRG
jgi:hypothetical protein